MRACRRCRPGGSARRRGAGTRGRCPAGVAHDDQSRSASCGPATQSRAPPRGVNLTAFESRFQTTCCRRSASPHHAGQARRRCRSSSVMPFALGGRPHHVERRVDDLRQVDRPDLEPQLAGDDARHVEHVLDELRLRLGVALDGSRARAPCSAGSTFAERSTRAQPSMALSGVRSSCETVARNSSLSRLACCSRTSNCARSSSMRRRSAISRLSSRFARDSSAVRAPTSCSSSS